MLQIIYFLFWYERNFMLSLSDNNQSEVIEAFNSTSRYMHKETKSATMNIFRFFFYFFLNDL